MSEGLIAAISSSVSTVNVHVLDTADFSVVTTIPFTASNYISAADFSLDGNYLAVASGVNPGIRIYDRQDNFSQVSITFPANLTKEYGFCRFNHASTMLVLGKSYGGKLNVLDVAGGWLDIAAVSSLNITYTTQAEFSPDDSLLVIGTEEPPYLKVLVCSDWSSRTLDVTFSGIVDGVSFSRDGSKLAVYTRNSAVLRILDTATLAQVGSVTLPGSITSIDFYHKSDLVAVLVGSTIYIVDATAYTYTTPPISAITASNITVSTGDIYIATSLYASPPRVRVVTIPDWSSQIISLPTGPTTVSFVGFSPEPPPPPIVLAETISVSDALSCFIDYGLLDMLGIVDTSVVTPTYSMRDSTSVTTPLALQTAITFSPTDSAAFTGACFSIHTVDLPTTISVTDDLNAAVRAVLELAVLIEAQDTQTTSLSIAVSLLETLVAQDVIYQLAELDLDETLAIADQLSNAIQAHLALPETTQLLAELETAIVIPCTETVALTDTGTISVSAMLNLSDGAAFIARLPLEDGDYQAWVMNAETTGTTQYVNYPMNSLFTFKGVPYGVSETGLYRLEGETDDGDPINSIVATGDMNFGTSREKNIPRCYLYLTQTGQVVLKTISSRQGSRHETYYELAERATDSTDDDTYRRVPLGRGVRGVWWRFEIHALNGATINLDGAEIRPVVLSRRG